MRHRRYLLVAALALAACSSDGGGSPSPASPGSTGGVPTTGAGALATTPAPVEGPLDPPVEHAALLQPDIATALANLGFPQGWVLPTAAGDVTGLLVRYSRGDDVYATFRTAYRVDGTDPEAVGEEWATRVGDSLGIDIGASGTINSDLGTEWLFTSHGDAERGSPSIDLEVVQPTGSTELTVVVEYQTLDRAFPTIAFPTTIDPTLPSLGGCTPRRVDVDLAAYVEVSMPAEPPVYRLWWESDCPAASFADAVAWAKGHDLLVGDGATSFTQIATLADGTTVEVSASQLDDGGTYLSVIVERPVSGA